MSVRGTLFALCVWRNYFPSPSRRRYAHVEKHIFSEGCLFSNLKAKPPGAPPELERHPSSLCCCRYCSCWSQKPKIDVQPFFRSPAVGCGRKQDRQREDVAKTTFSQTLLRDQQSPGGIFRCDFILPFVLYEMTRRRRKILQYFFPLTSNGMCVSTPQRRLSMLVVVVALALVLMVRCFKVAETGMYVVLVANCEPKTGSIIISGHSEWKNPYGEEGGRGSGRGSGHDLG